MLEYHPLDKLKMMDVAQHVKDADNFTFFEFGVATANTMCAMLDSLIELYKIPTHIFGFDSFEGLPPEDPSAAQNPEWFPEAFNIVDEFKNRGIHVHTNFAGVEFVMNRLNQYPFDVKLIIAWYEHLSDELVVTHNIQPARYIHIDCDMYSSAIQALSWIARNDLIANECVVRYDDWKENDNMGEKRAHLEICKQFGYKAEFIPSRYDHNIMFRFYK